MAKPGEYDFVPVVGKYSNQTISVGIFQWIYRADGHGLKKSKVAYRVKGPANKWKEINARASQICSSLNAGCFLEVLAKKSETI